MASSGRLKPGEKGKIVVTIDTAGRTGPQSKMVQIFTNVPGHPISTLSIRVMLKPL